mgnify:CR=1 FL=1
MKLKALILVSMGSAVITLANLIVSFDKADAAPFHISTLLSELIFEQRFVIRNAVRHSILCEQCHPFLPVNTGALT